MRKWTGWLLVLLSGFFLLAPVQVQARVSVDGEGGVNSRYGEGWIRSKMLGDGHGQFNEGDEITGNWAVFHCINAGTAACATDLTPNEAVRVDGGRFRVNAPLENERAYIGRHNFSVEQCGRVQYDFGVDGVGTVGGWVHDYGRDCVERVETNYSDERRYESYESAVDACSAWEPVNTQFRVHTGSDTPWVSGSDLSQLRTGQRIDVNCFAKNGTALLKDAEIRVVAPSSEQTVFNGAELRNYPLHQAGTYRFTCVSETIHSCSNIDTVRVRRQAEVVMEDDAVCRQLVVLGGNNEMAPRRVRFRTDANDVNGNDVQYRYHFGDGTVASGQREVEHRYETGGLYRPYVEVKGANGRWVRSAVCEQEVFLKTAAFASEHAGCSEVEVLSGNNERAPSTVRVRVRGFDNQGEVGRYRVLVDGEEMVSEDGIFDIDLNQPGTVEVRGFVEDSNGEWVNGSDACRVSVQALTGELKGQPDTGVPVEVAGVVLGSGVVGFGLWRLLQFI